MAILSIGHRGACGYEPENTLRSFRKAIELHVDMIELDVHICKTGELVVIHDASVNRTTNGKGVVKDKTLEELALLDAGKGEKIPLLKEVFDLIQRKAKINVELKGKKTARPVIELIQDDVDHKGWTYDDFLVSSSDLNELSEVAKINREVKMGVLPSKSVRDVIESAAALQAFSVHPHLQMVTEEFVEKAHHKGMKVFVWTVNRPKEIQRMKSLKVDGIFSDYPDRLIH